MLATWEGAYVALKKLKLSKIEETQQDQLQKKLAFEREVCLRTLHFFVGLLTLVNLNSKN